MTSLGNSELPDDKTPEQLAEDVEYQNSMARALLASVNAKGELDADRLMRSIKR